MMSIKTVPDKGLYEVMPMRAANIFSRNGIETIRDLAALLEDADGYLWTGGWGSTPMPTNALFRGIGKKTWELVWDVMSEHGYSAEKWRKTVAARMWVERKRKELHKAQKRYDEAVQDLKEIEAGD